MNASMVEAFFFAHVRDVKNGSDGQRSGKCPFHEDRAASFSFNVDKACWTCHAGCGQGGLNEFARRLGLPESSIPSLSGPGTKRAIMAIYDYRDESGTLLFQAVRYAPKQFVQRRPDRAGGWLYKLGDVRRVPYRLPDLLAANKRAERVYIVEGEKDVEKLRACGLTATCNPMGAGKWRDEYNQHFTGREVVVIPDNDEPGRVHASQVAASLRNVAASVKLVELPGLTKKGEDVSDWLAAGHTIQELTLLADRASTYSGDAAEVADQTASPRKSWFSDGGAFYPAILAQEIAREHHFLASPIDDDGKGVRLHVYARGVFGPDGTGLARRRAHKLLGDVSKPERIESAAALIKEGSKVAPSELNLSAMDLLNVQNGMLNWHTGELKSHSPEYRSTFQIAATFAPSERSEVLDNFLSEVFPQDALLLAEELVGYLLRPTTKFQKAFMLLGDGANGKSTFLSMLTAFMGADCVSNVSLQDLSENRFKVAELLNKLVNMYADLPSKSVEQSDMFKNIVSGDPITAEKKFGHPFRLVPTARLLFSANELPKSADLSPAYFRRWAIIPFPNKFEGSRAKKDLLGLLTTPQARSALLNRAVEGLRRLEAQQEFTACASVQEAGQTYRRQCDSALEFINSCLEADTVGSIGKQKLYEGYQAWCVEAGIPAMAGQRDFNSRLETTLHATEGREDGKRVWRGLRWRAE